MSLVHTPSFRRMPTADQIRAEHTILLVDQSTPRASTIQDQLVDAERNGSDAQSFSSTTASELGGLHKRLTNNSANIQQSLRREITKQKYARYGQDRYEVGDVPSAAPPADDSTLNLAQTSGDANARNHTERGQVKSRAPWRRKKRLGKGKDEHDTVMDILYENQRGVFFFGIPKYSSNSLLPTDPKPWQNAQFRTSASDIRNAQVPDPSWEWAWKSWYVDMSRDVDEEGWEYSFAFVGQGARAFAWHGNHPWFNSFVRRRRWLRMRKRRDLTHHTREKAHELTADYFTIHPRSIRPSSLLGTQNRSSTLITTLDRVEESEKVDAMEIINIADLLRALRKAKVDRERLLAVGRFTDDGGDELVYLSERMDDVMGMLIFQNSRRQLLGDLISRHEGAHTEQKRLAAHEHEDDEEKQKAHDKAVRYADYLLRAVHAADEHVQRLEYWSDMKVVSRSAAGTDNEEAHDRPSFKNKQKASDGTPKLHKHPEHGRPAVPSNDPTSRAPANTSGIWYDAVAQQSSERLEERSTANNEANLERFTTAAESKTELSGKPDCDGTQKADNPALANVPEEGDLDSDMADKPIESPSGNDSRHADEP